MRKNVYRKATGVSLVIHGIVLSLVLWFGSVYPLPANASVVEIVPATVIDMSTMEFSTASLAEPNSQQTVHETTPTKGAPQPAKVSQDSLSPVLQGKSDAPSIIQPTSNGTRTVDSVESTVKDYGGSKEEIGESKREISPTSARVLNGSSPKYPAEARQSGWEGTVLVRVLVDVDGSAASVAVRDSSGRGLFDDVAVQTVRTWRFSPATQAGKPVASYHDVRVRFHLTDS